jgi:predicted nucleic acid-binding protein
MSELTFVDANILLYARDSGQALKQSTAIQHVHRLWQNRTGRTSVQVLSEYYVTLTRKLKPGIEADDAWDDVRALMAWEPQPIDCEVLKMAREIERRYLTSWWDSTIIAAAEIQSCTRLLSEDFQHGMAFGQVIVHNPFESRVEDVFNVYQAPTANSRYRNRGRPAQPPRGPNSRDRT